MNRPHRPMITPMFTPIFCAGAPAAIAIPAGFEPVNRGAFTARATGRAFGVHDAAGDTTSIDLYDEIGRYGIGAAAFKAKLDAITTPNIALNINSPGGEVFDGVAIHNDLVRHPAKVHVMVTGIAASIASVIAMAGDTITMAHNAMMMVHRASSIMYGNEEDFRKAAATLATIDGVIAATYVKRTGGDSGDIRAMMQGETWMTAQSALDEGFADRIDTAAEEATARFDLSMFNNVPAALAQMKAARARPSERDLERALRDAGCSRNAAKAILAGGVTAARDVPNDDPDAGPRDAGNAWDCESLAALARLTETVRPRARG